ncbi:MAG: DUF1566 domain-containing protein [Pseudomonadales bacterium]|nr:DUF1566 domain-containing protein [Pseudomonadales bacterium]
MKILPILILLFCHTSYAALVDRDNGMIYDSNLNITWLSDANYSQTSGYDSDGKMNHDEAFKWASGLTFGGSENWRLPSTNELSPQTGYNLITADLGNLFYVTSGSNSGQAMNPLAEFYNVQQTAYWLNEEGTLGLAWVFHTQNGLQTLRDSSTLRYAWAVHEGDIGASDLAGVPTPSASLLFGSSLVGFLVCRRKH